MNYHVSFLSADANDTVVDLNGDTTQAGLKPAECSGVEPDGVHISFFGDGTETATFNNSVSGNYSVTAQKSFVGVERGVYFPVCQ